MSVTGVEWFATRIKRDESVIYNHCKLYNYDIEGVGLTVLVLHPG